MKKILIILLIPLTLAAIYYFVSPRQERYSDDHFKQQGLQTETKEKEPEKDRVQKDVFVYYFAEDDTSCTGSVHPVNLQGVAPGYKKNEINAIVPLLILDTPEGYKNAFIQGTQLHGLRITDGVAEIDMSHFLTLNAEKDCGLQSRKAQVEATLKQFDRIESIVYKVDGTQL